MSCMGDVVWAMSYDLGGGRLTVSYCRRRNSMEDRMNTDANVVKDSGGK